MVSFETREKIKVFYLQQNKDMFFLFCDEDNNINIFSSDVCDLRSLERCLRAIHPPNNWGNKSLPRSPRWRNKNEVSIPESIKRAKLTRLPQRCGRSPMIRPQKVKAQ